MKITQQKKNSQKNILISIIVIILVAGGAFAYFYFNENSNIPVKQAEDKPENSNIKEPTTNNDDTESTDNYQEEPTKVKDKTPIQYEGEDQSTETVDPDGERFRIPEDE